MRINNFFTWTVILSNESQRFSASTILNIFFTLIYLIVSQVQEYMEFSVNIFCTRFCTRVFWNVIFYHCCTIFCEIIIKIFLMISLKWKSILQFIAKSKEKIENLIHSSWRFIRVSALNHNMKKKLSKVCMWVKIIAKDFLALYTTDLNIIAHIKYRYVIILNIRVFAERAGCHFI